MAGRLQDKRCLIVGGTSGIGRAAAERFEAEGARILVAGLPDHDATNPQVVEHLFMETTAALGGLDVLYHVAGGSGRRHGDGSLHDCTDDGWRWTLDANLTSTFLTNRAAVRSFLAQKTPGVILNMASVLALDPAPRHFDTCAYVAAKGAVVALSRYAAARYAGDSIRVNVLAPGLIDTPMAARAMEDEAIQHFLRTKQPLARGAGTPEDCVGAAVFLCSDEARLITGAVVPVDGGWRLSDGQYA